MDKYIITLYYPKNKYPTFADLLNHITNDDIYFEVVSCANKDKLYYSDHQLDCAIIGYNRFILEPLDFFVPFDIKKYIANPRSSYQISTFDGNVLYHSVMYNFVSKKGKDRFILYNINGFDVYHDLDNNSLLIVSNDDIYGIDQTIFRDIYEKFNCNKEYIYLMDSIDYSIDHHVVKFQLKENKVFKFLKKYHLM